MNTATSPTLPIRSRGIKTVLLTALALALSSCGGGGGGGSDTFVGAADIALSTQPHTIDTGDNVSVRIEIESVHSDGIALKIRFPSELRYVPGSGTLTVDESDHDITPINIETVDEKVYVVYYLSHSQFGKNGHGEVTLELEGTSLLKEGEVEVDPDVDDPKIDNSVEFDAHNPDFVAESSDTIEVKG